MNTRELSPALLGSAALHLGLAALLLISWGRTRDLKIGSVVPVTIVSDAPAAELSPALQAPESQAAQAEEPAPEAPPTPVPPAPEPTPQPPTPAPSAKPAAPAKPTTPAKADKGLDLDALAASVSKMARPTGAKTASATRGPARPETAPVARTGQGTAPSAAAMSGFVEDLQRRWNPNCDVAGGRDVLVRATFQVGAGGQLVGDVAAEASGARASVAEAARLRAISAVQAAAPFRNLPRELYGQRVRVNFIAREACS